VTIDRNIGKYYAEFIGNYVGMFGPGSATNRFWPSPGNHDWVQPDLKPYTQYFTLPNNERYYDVDLGLVHLWAMDSDEHEPDGNQATSTQGKWLQARLPASKACYDLVFFHYPPHSTGDHGDNPVMDWPFEAWGAEAVMSGHDHDYERFQFGNLPYFVNGMGGAGNYTFSRAQPPESKFRVGSGHGAMLITATSSSITYEFWTFDGKKIDTLTVPKKCS
jgi:tartrate-resistant acid phosphatase type 5